MNITEKNVDKIYDAICYYLGKNQIDFYWDFNKAKLMFLNIYYMYNNNTIIFTYASKYVFRNLNKLPRCSKLKLKNISECTGIKLKVLKHQLNKILVKVLKKSNLIVFSDNDEFVYKNVNKINDVAELFIYKDIMN